jgi:hypothetical protein
MAFLTIARIVLDGKGLVLCWCWLQLVFIIPERLCSFSPRHKGYVLSNGARAGHYGKSLMFLCGFVMDIKGSISEEVS